MTTATATGPARARWLALGVIALAQLMVVLDATIVNIALPSAQKELGFSDGDRQWVITAYSLGFGCLLLLGGRLADRFGRRRAFLTGLTGFALASAVGGAANSLALLLVARAVQGVFAALLAPAALAMLTTTFVEPRERSRAFGIFGAVAGSGAAIGLLLGGVLTEYLSWRWCLYVNLGFAVVAFVGGVLLLDRRRASEAPGLDVLGTVSVSTGLFALVYGFAHAETAGWSNPLTVSLFAVGLLLLAAFVLIESRVREPLLPLRLLTDRNRGGAYLTTFVLNIGMFAAFLFITYYMQTVLDLSAVQSGLAFLPMSLVIIATAAGTSTLLATRVSPKIVIPTGLTVAAAGMFLLTQISVHGSYWHHVLPASLVLGLGLGAVFAFASNVATQRVDPPDAGVASAMVSVGQQVGGSLGTAALNTIAASAVTTYLRTHHGAQSQVSAAAAVHSFVVGFAVAGTIYLVGAVVLAVLLRPGVPTAASAAPTPVPQTPLSQPIPEVTP